MLLITLLFSFTPVPSPLLHIKMSAVEKVDSIGTVQYSALENIKTKLLHNAICKLLIYNQGFLSIVKNIYIYMKGDARREIQTKKVSSKNRHKKTCNAKIRLRVTNKWIFVQ